MTTLTRLSALAILALALAAGCNKATQGVEGKLLFTPDDCGRLGCDFAASIGVGGTIEVYITGTEGVSTEGVNLVSDAPDVLTVTPLPDVNNDVSRWELHGAGPGVARLVGLSADGSRLDYIDVTVQELSGLVMLKIVGDTMGPYPHDSHDEYWIVPADERVLLQVTPVIGDGLGESVPTMGRYVYVSAFNEEDFFAEYITDSAILRNGQLDFTAPPGQYSITFYDNYDHALSVLIEAKP